MGYEKSRQMSFDFGGASSGGGRSGSADSFGGRNTGSACSGGSRSGSFDSGFEGSSEAYSKIRQAFRAKAYAPRTVSAAGGKLDYQVGDTVRHARFGDGVVKEIADGGRDYEVTVDFDGTVKKMFASFANLHKI